jgi:hypothetical protein
MNRQKLLAILVLVVLVITAFCFYRKGGLPSELDNRWQAVFLTDGQVYFGRLDDYNRNFVVLNEVYYLKFSRGLQQDGEEALSERNLNLIKLGGEAHGPEGEMYIARNHILFIENLKESSKVTQAILSNKGNGQ